MNIYTYPSGRIHLKLENKNEEYDLTIDIPDLYMKDKTVFLDPSIMTSGILRVIKKARILNKVVGMINYNYVDIPIGILNNGILREYDSIGFSNHIDETNKK